MSATCRWPKMNKVLSSMVLGNTQKMLSSWSRIKMLSSIKLKNVMTLLAIIPKGLDMLSSLSSDLSIF
jgi:hypothetical protein